MLLVSLALVAPVNRSPPKTWAKFKVIDPVAPHTSWKENFPITPLAGVVQLSHRQPMVDYANLASMTLRRAREIRGNGNFGGDDRKPNDPLAARWQVAVTGARERWQVPWR